jgi:hypothetical protein
MKHLKHLKHRLTTCVFTLLPYDAAQSGGTASFDRPAPEDGGRQPMRGRVGQASGGPSAGVTEDGGRRP